MVEICSKSTFRYIESKAQEMKMEEPGLYLDVDKPFIGANPDRIISSLCHGKMCVEIKCPYSISDKSPTNNDVNLKFLIKGSDGNKELRKSQGYFSQCQHQMGVTGLKKCIFFVYTAHGHIMNEIEFDQYFYDDLSEKCDWYVY